MPEEQNSVAISRVGGFAGNATFIILAILGFLMPFFFIPSLSVPLQLSKGMLLAIGVSLATIFFIISLIKDGKVALPKNLFFLSIFLIPTVALLSAIITGAPFSFFGFPFELGTVVFLFFLAWLVFLVSETFRSKENIFYSLLGFFVAALVVALFQLIRVIFGAGALSFGLFQSTTSNLLGNWNDLGIFFAGSALLSVVTLEMMRLARPFKFLTYAILVVSIFFLALVNFAPIWIALGIFSLVFFIYLISFDHFSPGVQKSVSSSDAPSTSSISEDNSQTTSPNRKISYAALTLIVISAIFLFAGDSLGNRVVETFNISSLEVRPAWSSTFDVVGASLKENALVGSGPNTFGKLWNLYKPDIINQSVFWNTDFNYGIGLIPSMFATLGVLGILAWIFFLAMLIWTGIRTIFQPISDLFSRYLITASFLGSLFFWVMAVLYVPSVANVFLAFFFTGLFAASLRREGLLNTKVFTLAHHPRLSFVSVLVLVALLIGSVALGYAASSKGVSFVYFQKSLRSFQGAQDVDRSQEHLIKAINIADYDVYYRALSELYLVRVNNLLNQPIDTPEAIQEEFQFFLGNAIEAAREATRIDPNNSQNWLSLARVYAALVPDPFAIPGAYENALNTYQEAQKVAPKNPAIPLLLARLEVARAELEPAREYALQAINLKPNYAEAHFLVAQIAATLGNTDEAIPALETTLILSPNEPGLFFQLGLLKYTVADYSGAIEAFSKAVALVPDYANARYFLGLSLYQVGRAEESLNQFLLVQETNPENSEVNTIIENIRAGKAPLSTISPPLPQPQNRDTLPVAEE